MDGLECSEILLSQVRQYEPFRIDSHFYEKQYRALKKALSSLPCSPLKDLVKKTIQTGHTPSMAINSYYGGNIALIKTDNLHDNSIGTIFTDYLTDEGNNVILRTELSARDIITTIIGATESVIARSAIVTEEHLPANINQNIVQIRINPQKVAPEYVNTYLNTKYGKQYLIYLSRQTEQYNLNCKEVELVLIPLLSDEFQKEVIKVVCKASEHQIASRFLFNEASAQLDTALNVHVFEQEKPVLSIRQISESFCKTSRLDAEYYQPKYDKYLELVSAYKNGYSYVRTEFDQITEKCDRKNSEYSYVEIGDIDVNNGAASFNVICTDELPANAKIMTKCGDILVSTVRPNRGAVTILESDKLLVSGAFTVLRQKGSYKKEVLQTLLRTELYRDWLLQYNVGTSYPVIKDDDVLNMPIPLFEKEIQNDIEAKIQKSVALRQKAKELLEYAKQAVEMAIEQGENAALEWLKLKTQRYEVS